MRDNTHGGEGRLIQLRYLTEAPLQLKQNNVESHDHVGPYATNLKRYVTGVACHRAVLKDRLERHCSDLLLNLVKETKNLSFDNLLKLLEQLLQR
jgi:hypothetical protein